MRWRVELLKDARYILQQNPSPFVVFSPLWAAYYHLVSFLDWLVP